MPDGETRARAHLVRPEEIRRRGFVWPLPGVAASAYPVDGKGRVDLDHVLADLRRSLRRWQGEHRAARDMAARASRDSYEGYEEAKAGRVQRGARVGEIRESIAAVERLVAELDRAAARAVWWRRALLGAYVLVALTGFAIHVRAFERLPGEWPRVEGSDDWTEAEAVARGERAHTQVHDALPAAARWLAPSALFWLDDRARTLVSPSAWVLENSTLEKRVDDFNECVAEVSIEYRNTATLMLSIFGVALLLGLVAAVRPNVLTAVALCLPPLFATPVLTEPLIGVDNAHLLPWALPLLLLGGGFLVIQGVIAARIGLAGPRGDHWLEVWVGAALVVLGAGVTLVGLLLVRERTGATVLTVAVAPALYGLYLVGHGLQGLVRRLDRRGSQGA